MRLSVVVPVYGCLDALDQLSSRISQTVERITTDYEVVFVDDGNNDDSWIRIKSQVETQPNFRAIKLSRNFGQHAAILAGLVEAIGDHVVVIDCDLQDPPELIPQLYSEALNGHDVVLTKREQRSHSLFRRKSADFFASFVSRLTGNKLDSSFGSMSLMSRKVVEAYLSIQDKERHHLYILNWLGFKTTVVGYQQDKRHSGRSSYTLPKLMRHAISGVVFQSSSFLSFIAVSGLVVAFVGAFLAGWIVWAALSRGLAPGWTSLAVLMIIGSGVNLFAIGIVGLYLGRVFDQTKGRPLYVVETRIGKTR